jgi:hypothetical protein
MMATVFSITWSRLLTRAAFYGDFVVGVALSLWLLEVLSKKGVRRELPWFFLFICWGLFSALVGLVASIAARRFYVTVFWTLEIPGAALMTAAMQEGLLDMFKRLRAVLHWFMPGVLAFVILYCALRATFFTSFPGNRLVSFELSSEFTLRWSLVIVVIAALAMTYFAEEAWNTRGIYAVIGISIISLAYVAWSNGLSGFGLSALFIAKYLPSLGYFFATLFWIRRFSVPLAQFSLQDMGIGLEDVQKRLGLFAQTLEMIKRLW